MKRQMRISGELINLPDMDPKKAKARRRTVQPQIIDVPASDQASPQS
jgi:hypothetical protein